MTTRTGYSRLQIGLHWTIGLLIVGNYFFSDGMEQAFDGMMESGTAPVLWTSLHIYTGVLVLTLAVIRLGVRLSRGAPPAASVSLLDRVGTVSHWSLYALMIAAPALGAISWYGGVDSTANIHVLVVNAMMILILVHSAAALFHQYFIKDGLLLRMMRPE